MSNRLVSSALFSCLVGAAFLSPATAATQIGKVAAVLGSPSASGPGGDRKLSKGDAVFEDDKIVVGNAGNAQIILNDSTRLVVGPGSSLLLDRFVMKGGGKAQKVGIKALRGTFRFITGKSAKGAYDIQTANATIGIRGTGFDISVGSRTAAVVLEGNIDLCNAGTGKGKCVNLESDCEVGRAGGGQATELNRAPAATTLVRSFPYVLNQGALGSSFRLPVGKCDQVLSQLPRRGDREPRRQSPRPD